MTTLEQAHISIAGVEGAALLLAQATNRETELADARSLEKDAAIRRLMAAGTYTSVTAAEKYVEADPEFLAHRKAEREAVVARIVMQGKYEAAKLRARLAVEQWTVDATDEESDDLTPLRESDDVIDRVDRMLDEAGIQEKDTQGNYLGIDTRVAMVLRALKPQAVE